jgi:putative transcriptional regulator
MCSTVDLPTRETTIVCRSPLRLGSKSFAGLHEAKLRLAGLATVIVYAIRRDFQILPPGAGVNGCARIPACDFFCVIDTLTIASMLPGVDDSIADSPMAVARAGHDRICNMSQPSHQRGSKGKRSGVRTHKVSVSPDEIQNARKQLGLSQDQFADAFGVSASTLRKWEQGQRSPTGAAKTLLKIIEREPKAVVRALKAG